MSYVDLNTIHNPATGTAPPASWGDQVRDNFEALYYRGPVVCTSGTRPPSPTKGDSIYETDTGELLVYYGATTGWRRPWKMPWGLVQRATYSEEYGSATAGGGALEIVPLGLSWTAVANRNYPISIKAEVSASAADGAYVIVYADSSSSQITRVTDACLTTSSQSFILRQHETPSSGGLISRKLLLSKIGGTGTILVAASATSQAIASVEDIGPLTTSPPAS